MFNLPHQTFSWFDIPLLLLLFVLELLLSTDNATMMAFIVRDLPDEKRKKALFIGLFSSFILRGAGILFAAYLIKIFWIQIIGGVYLVFLGIKHIANFKKEKKNTHTEKRSLFKAVVCIEAVDLLFALDSILAAFALAAIYYPYSILYQKIWVIYAGGILGVFFVRFVTTGVVSLLETYPHLEKTIYFLMAWMGLKLIIEGVLTYNSSHTVQNIFDITFWLGTLVIIILGFLSTKWDKKV